MGDYSAFKKMRLFLVIFMAIFLTSCDPIETLKKKLTEIKAKAGKAFCAGAKQGVVLGAAQLTKNYECKQAIRCLKSLPIIEKCYTEKDTYRVFGPEMAIAGLICKPVVSFIMSSGAKKIASKEACDCNYDKLNKDMQQATIACTFLGVLE